MRRAAVSVLLAAALLVAPASAALTPRQYVARMSAICRDAARSARAFRRPHTQAEAAAYLRRALALARPYRARLRRVELEAPRGTIRGYQGDAVELAQRVVDQIRLGLARVRAGERPLKVLGDVAVLSESNQVIEDGVWEEKATRARACVGDWRPPTWTTGGPTDVKADNRLGQDSTSTRAR
jgi:hypothetical protein